jgi:hypothetical protein
MDGGILNIKCTTLQTRQEKWQEMNRWSIISLKPQKIHLVLPLYRIIGQLRTSRQTLTFNFSQKMQSILYKNYTIGFIFKRTFQWYNFYIKYLIFSWLKLMVKVCLKIHICVIIRYGGRFASMRPPLTKLNQNLNTSRAEIAPYPFIT